MKNIFYKFKWYETNFKSESQRFRRFLETAKQKSIGITSLKAFPPCILENDSFAKIKYENAFVKAGKKSIIITNNLFFGDDFFKINNRFTKSPFTSDTCRKCKFHKEALCRGLMNKDFIERKKSITKRIGYDKYNAIRADYENDMFVVGSQCSKKCYFCFDRFIPKNILRVVPFLTPEEVFHFLHYIPKLLHYFGNSYHCRSGEISESPYLNRVLSLAKRFSDEIYWITNGWRVDEEAMDQLRKANVIVSLSVFTLSQKWKRYFAKNNESWNLFAVINMLRKNQIEYCIGIVPFKSLIDTGDIFKTIDMLFENDSNCKIRMQMPSSCKFFTSKIKDEFLFDYQKFKSDILKKYSQKSINFIDDLYCETDKPDVETRLKHLRKQFKKICSKKGKHLILCPERTCNYFKTLATNHIKIKRISSSLGYTNPCAGALRIEDYIKGIKEENGEFDSIILPKNSFDVNFDDFSLININDFWAEAKKKSKALVFM